MLIRSLQLKGIIFSKTSNIAECSQPTRDKAADALCMDKTLVILLKLREKYIDPDTNAGKTTNFFIINALIIISKQLDIIFSDNIVS